MYNQVIFYNHFGAGDLFESRSFVKAWMALVPSNHYFYSHGKSEKIFLDIKKLEFKSITEHMKVMSSTRDDGHGNLYVNTWIGRNSKYVLPGIGCTVEKLFEMHNDMLAENNLGCLPGSPSLYLPTIDYKKFNISKVTKFMKKNDQEKIFIDNGLVQSSQAFNFPFNDPIITIANKYPDKLFITSQAIQSSSNNIIHAGEIIGSAGWGFDLNEMSYLSTFCTTLIGRNSGPHVFSQTMGNCSDPSKKLLSFTYEPQGASFVVNTDVAIRKFWSNSTSHDDVVRKIEEVLNA